GMRMMEAGVEAGLRFEELMNQGYSVEYSSKESVELGFRNMPLALIDAGQVGLLVTPMGKGFATFLKAVFQPISEGAEEVYQEGISAAQDEHIAFLRGEVDSHDLKYV